MQHNYFSYLDYRVAQRRLAAKFARPRALMFHILVFVATITAIWYYGTAQDLWFYRDNITTPVLIGFVWSLLLAIHAVIHYRRSAAMVERRDLAVEEEMRQFVEKNGDLVDDETLFAMHRQLEGELERQGRWSLALLAFTILNAVSWVASVISMGTSWAFQMTLPLTAIIGGVNVYLIWQQQRREGRAGWFVSLPLRHMIAYAVGSIGLWFAAGYQMINHWDADTLFKVWSVVLLIHIVWSIVVWPVIQGALPERLQSEQRAKRKPAARLALADDGEMLDIVDEDSLQSQAKSL